MKLKQYQKYKDSGIQWIGKIPEEWGIKKVKHFSISIAGGTPATNNSAYWDGNIPWLPSGIVHNKPINENEVKIFITFDGLNNSSTKWIKKDAVLVALTGATCANIGFLTFKATANQSVIGIECDKKTNSKFIFYYLLSQREQILLNQTGGAQAGINKEDVKNLFCVYPTKQEQENLSIFLDSKISEIDLTIEKDKQLIELLKEKRIALINHVVTKGLNSKVKMKDSGVKWIGEIPDMWEIKKIKHVTNTRISNVDKKSNPNEPEVQLCNYTNVYYNEFITDEINFMKATCSFEQKNKFSLQKGDVMITKDSEIPEDIAVPAVSKDNFKDVVCGYHLAFIRPNKDKVSGEYLMRLLQSKGINTQFVIWALGVTRFGVSTYPIKNSYVLIPPKTEQIQIVKYLDKVTSKIDQTINKIQEKIKLMEEYKKSLIHHVVTGKFDVRRVIV